MTYRLYIEYNYSNIYCGLQCEESEILYLDERVRIYGK